MKKRDLIIITIIMTIISLIMILFTYFGITRYLMLRFQSTETYIENYHKLPKSDSKKVIIVVHSTSERLNKIQPMINSILDQTIKVDRIFLTSSSETNLPPYLKKVATILPIGKNYGDSFANSLIPILMHEKECDTTIIALLDNVIYGKDFIENMVNLSEKTPKMVIVDSKKYAILIKPEYYDYNILDRNKNVYTEKWFLSNAPNKSINYKENYSY